MTALTWKQTKHGGWRSNCGRFVIRRAGLRFFASRGLTPLGGSHAYLYEAKDQCTRTLTTDGNESPKTAGDEANTASSAITRLTAGDSSCGI